MKADTNQLKNEAKITGKLINDDKGMGTIKSNLNSQE